MFFAWMSAHRSLFFGIICFSIWAFGYYWYFRKDVRNYRLNRKPHKWVVDMETKKGVGGRAKQIH